jgi:hypothetical protein
MARRAGNARIRSYAERYRCDGNDSGRTVVMPFGLRLARYRLKVCTRIPIVTSSIACAHRDDGGHRSAKDTYSQTGPGCANRRSII